MVSDSEPGPVVTKTNPYLFTIEGEEDAPPGLKVTRCRDCSRFTLGRVKICSLCFSRSVEAAVAGRTATLVEHSIAHHPAGGFEAPYAIGLLRTTEGLTLFAPIAGDVANLHPGSRLRFVNIPHSGGTIGFAYAPREE